MTLMFLARQRGREPDLGRLIKVMTELGDLRAHMAPKFLPRLWGGLPPWVAFVNVSCIRWGSYRDGSADRNIHADRQRFERVGDKEGLRTG